MNKAEFEIYQGIIIPLNVEPVECIELMKNLISELCILEIDFPVDEQTVKLKVEQIPDLEKNKKILWDQHKEYFRSEIILKFSATINFVDCDNTKNGQT